VTREDVTTKPALRKNARGALESARPVWIQAIEAISLLGFVLCWGLVAARVATSTPSERLLWMVPVALVAGYAAADFVSGAVHWFADTYLDAGTPILGPLLIGPFREHHADPHAITRHGLLELLGNNALATLPVAGVLLAFGAPSLGLFAQAAHTFLTALALALLATNALHRWAHMAEPPRSVSWLQRRLLVLSKEAHARHHLAAHDRSYCVTSGWLNPVLDRFCFFARIEALVSRVAETRRDLAQNRDRDLRW
jgi:hypothetical protein